MGDGTPEEGRDPDPEAVFGTLDDPTCRDIVESVDEPMSAKQVADAVDVALSTAYRKLDRLQEASLVSSETELDPGGDHRSRFRVDFERVIVALDDTRSLAATVEPRLSTPEEQLLDAWTAVCNEA